ncbi:MAG: hypothetical protein ACT4PE_14935 [Candidatus Eiseniibacteriota bacterium]
MILIVDPVTALDTDLRQLHPDLARPVFLQAIRYLRGLVHTTEGAWEAYREGRLLPKEADAVNAALEEHLGIEPEYARLVSLGFAHRQDGDWRVKTLTALNRQEEAEMLAAFWQIVAKSLRLQYQLVTYGGARWGIPFVLRRTLLHDMTPAASLPIGRARTDIHFDVSEVLANWDRGRARPLELAAIQYTIPGPWDATTEEEPIDSAGGIRHAVGTADLERVRFLAESRLSAIGHLDHRLARTYLAASA